MGVKVMSRVYYLTAPCGLSFLNLWITRHQNLHVACSGVAKVGEVYTNPGRGGGYCQLMTIRPTTPADAAALARICLVTGDYGADATGLYGDDRALADVFATPYLHGPGGFALVWDEGDGPLGYVLGTDNTRAFQRWFVDQWWPSRPAREPRVAGDRWLLPAAADPERMLIDQVDAYPAHLHIDLLPPAQGRGAGRQLLEAACDLLTERNVAGVHATAGAANIGALAFYPRVGFVRVAHHGSAVTFGRRLTG